MKAPRSYAFAATVLAVTATALLWADTPEENVAEWIATPDGIADLKLVDLDFPELDNVIRFTAQYLSDNPSVPVEDAVAFVWANEPVLIDRQVSWSWAEVREALRQVAVIAQQNPSYQVNDVLTVNGVSMNVDTVDGTQVIMSALP